MNEQTLFTEALERADPRERAAFLDRACHGNPALRQRVERLLAQHQHAGDFLEAPADAAAPVLTDEPVTERPGARIGPYKLVEPIGEGGMGTVWMAQQTAPVQRRVALKLVKAGMDSKQVVARFEAERQALAMMDHANIARVFDGGTTDHGRPYFVMELVHGVPITQYCDDNHLTPRERLELFVPVCQAIQHAHQKGVIHRDVKPSNVLVTLHDGKPVPKVIDFGVAKATEQKLTEKTLATGFGAVVGTLEYMSPEQADVNQPDVDTRSDIYALGVLLYELLTGTTPLEHERVKAVGLLEALRVIREEEPPRPSTRLGAAEGLPTIAANRGTEPRKLSGQFRGELDWIVMKALEKDRGRRYETASAFAGDVQRYLADEPVLAGPPSALYRFRKFARRNRGSVIAAGLVLLALVAGVGGTAWQAREATKERDAKQKALDQSQLLSAELAYDKGQLLGEQGDADLALLWMARSLELAPPGAVELQAAIRRGLDAWRRQVNSVRLALPHEDMVPAVGFAPDGTPAIANWNRATGRVTVQRWHPVTGDPEAAQVVSRPEGFDLGFCAFSPKADHLLLGFGDGTDGVVELVDLVTRKSVWGPTELRGTPECAAFSPDGRIVVLGLAVGTAKGKAQVLDFATGKERGPGLDHERPVQGVAFHPDGETFVTECGEWGNATEQAEARFWNLDGGESRPALKHPCVARAVAFSPDGHRLLTGHWDFKARLWDLAGNGEPVVLQHSGPLVSVTFSRDGETLMTGGLDGTICFWGRAGQRLVPPLRHSSLVQAAALAPDGKSVLVGVRAGNASRLWNLAALGSARQEAGERNFATLAVTPDRRTLLARRADHAVQLQDTAKGELIGKPLPHRRPVPIVGASVPPGKPHACSSDRLRAVTVDRDNVARLWDTATGELVEELKPDPERARQSTFYAAAFSPDGRRLATGNFHATVHVWESATGRLLRTLKHESQGPVFAVAFAPNGRTLVTGGADGSVRFWDAGTGEQLGPPIRHGPAVLALAISPDGNTVASVGIDPNVHLWDTVTRDRRQRMSGHQGGVNDLAFSPDGRLVLSGGWDRTARLWDVATGKPIGPQFLHPVGVVQVSVTEDGKSIATATDDERVREWPMPAVMNGTADEVKLWSQVTTGMELEADGAVRVLGASEWRARRQKLTGCGLLGW